MQSLYSYETGPRRQAAPFCAASFFATPCGAVGQRVRQSLACVGLFALVACLSSPVLAQTSGASADGDERALFSVLVASSTSETYIPQLVLSGYTKGLGQVDVIAETSSRVTAVNVRLGQRVLAGALLCRLDPGSRRARLSQASTQFSRAKFDLDATRQLVSQGTVGRSRLVANESAFESAKAALEDAQQELNRLTIVSPVDGVVIGRVAEVGENIGRSSRPCATILRDEKMLAVASVSERNVDSVLLSSLAEVTLLGKDEVALGRISFISSIANVDTRSFEIEVEIENADRNIRSGISARITIDQEPTRVHVVPRSSLVLGEGGVIGVRAVSDDDIVVFHPAQIVSDVDRGFLVEGLPSSVRTIVLGQYYVSEGQKVDWAEQVN